MELRKLERAYRAFIGSHRVVVKARGETDLFASLCRMLVDELGFRLAWVGLASPDDYRVRPVAQAGFEAGYLDAVDLSWAGNEERGLGPTGCAIRDGVPSVAQDIATDERFAPWRADALLRGYASSVAIPLSNGADRIGALSLYASEPDAFDDDEVALLEEMAVDVFLGVVRFRYEGRLAELDVLVERAARAETATTAATAIAHDVNNLLHIVSLSIAACLQTHDARQREEGLGDAARATSSAAAMTRQFFSLTRRARDTAEHIDVDAVVDALRPLLARLAPSATLEVHLGAAGGRSRIGRQDLERIVINLVVNAGHAMPSGGALTVSTRHERVPPEGARVTTGPLPGGSYVEVTVADAGVGIRPEVLPRILEPYFTTKGNGGTGLGLASVHHLVRAAGGGLSIESRCGVGTRISVFLPLAIVVAASAR